jgi:hypothetical protein
MTNERRMLTATGMGVVSSLILALTLSEFHELLLAMTASALMYGAGILIAGLRPTLSHRRAE